MAQNEQTTGEQPVTGKARSPSVVRRVDGMTSVDVEALGRRRKCCKNQLVYFMSC